MGEKAEIAGYGTENRVIEKIRKREGGEERDRDRAIERVGESRRREKERERARKVRGSTRVKARTISVDFGHMQ